MGFTTFEHRWIGTILPSFLGSEGALAVRDGEVDYSTAMEAMESRGTPAARLGMHAALFLVVLSPVWMLGRAQTFDELPVALRADVISRMVSHRLYLVRGLATLLKLNVTLAIMRAPTVRARTGYDRAAAARRALPVVSATQEG